MMVGREMGVSERERMGEERRGGEAIRMACEESNGERIKMVRRKGEPEGNEKVCVEVMRRNLQEGIGG